MDVGCYHAGKDAQRRRKTQQDWCTGATDIVVATVAFGMGIDRADVRCELQDMSRIRSAGGLKAAVVIGGCDVQPLCHPPNT